jgi:hypothetical protein
MYAARFELEGSSWSVCAGRVNASTAGVVPAALISALAEGRLGHLAVRCRFSTQGLQAGVLVPWDVAPSLERLQSELAVMSDIDWCQSAADFDAMSDELGPHRRWLDTSDFSVRGFPWLVDASWLPDWALFRRLGRQAVFTHQINITHRPPGIEEQRLLRKHVARLDLLADHDGWPAVKLQAQRRLIDRRLASPWLMDELIACDTETQCQALLAGLHGRLKEQGGAELAEIATQPGSFDELLLTGLDSDQFIASDALAKTGRSVEMSTLHAVLEQCDTADAGQVKAFDAFVSHAAADAPLAQRICSQLEAGGLRCWIAPRDIAAGHHYAEVIDDALRQSHAIVLLMSAAGMASQHVLRELERAVHYRALVLPVRLSAIEPQRAFSYLLSGCQWTDALPGSDEQAVVQRLLAGLRRTG